jgi:hypothetical protein
MITIVSQDDLVPKLEHSLLALILSLQDDSACQNRWLKIDQKCSNDGTKTHTHKINPLLRIDLAENTHKHTNTPSIDQ